MMSKKQSVDMSPFDTECIATLAAAIRDVGDIKRRHTSQDDDNKRFRGEYASKRAVSEFIQLLKRWKGKCDNLLYIAARRCFRAAVKWEDMNDTAYDALYGTFNDYFRKTTQEFLQYVNKLCRIGMSYDVLGILKRLNGLKMLIDNASDGYNLTEYDWSQCNGQIDIAYRLNHIEGYIGLMEEDVL
jgi:hypothetical protein